jgi:RNA polymerase sigma factor (sigma-70 family)
MLHSPVQPMYSRCTAPLPKLISKVHFERRSWGLVTNMNTEVTPDQIDDDTEATQLPMAALVLGAQDGDVHAWQEIIRRFTPLVISVTRGYRLSVEDAQDVSQVVWLKLFENISQLREPRALPGWVRTTAQRESFRQLKSARRTQAMDPSALACIEREPTGPDVDSGLLQLEREQAVTDGLHEIEPQHRTLLILLHADERPCYQAIGQTLGMPTGSIGPTRARGLQKLRNTKAISTFLQTESDAGLLATG